MTNEIIQFSAMSIWILFNTLSTNPTKWSNTLKQFVGKLLTNWLGVFDNLVWLALKGLNENYKKHQK